MIHMGDNACKAAPARSAAVAGQSVMMEDLALPAPCSAHASFCSNGEKLEFRPRFPGQPDLPCNCSHNCMLGVSETEAHKPVRCPAGATLDVIDKRTAAINGDGVRHNPNKFAQLVCIGRMSFDAIYSMEPSFPQLAGADKASCRFGVVWTCVELWAVQLVVST